MTKSARSRSMLGRLARTAALSALALSLAPLPAAAADRGEADAKAAEIAARTLDAMGGAEAWDDARFFRFSFAGFRTHYWDKYTGRHRLEFQNREGDRFLVLHNIQSREGAAYKNGEALAGDELSQALEGAYGAWINDTYWLLMPYKLRDPGTTLSYEGEEEIDGVAHDRLHLSFGGVGLTPGDQYWALIDKESGLMSRWGYFLQSYEEGREPTYWDWSGWTEFGGIQLAPGRKQVGGERELPLGDILVATSMADAVFTSTDAVSLDG